MAINISGCLESYKLGKLETPVYRGGSASFFFFFFYFLLTVTVWEEDHRMAEGALAAIQHGL